MPSLAAVRVQVFVGQWAAVEEGAPLVVVEAMKMEHTGRWVGGGAGPGGRG